MSVIQERRGSIGYKLRSLRAAELAKLLRVSLLEDSPESNSIKIRLVLDNTLSIFANCPYKSLS